VLAGGRCAAMVAAPGASEEHIAALMTGAAASA
jgi:hypothetical protein